MKILFTFVLSIFMAVSAHALSTESMPESDNVQVEQTSRCSNPDNSLERAQIEVNRQSMQPGWEKLKSIFIISPTMVKEVTELFFVMPTVSMAPRLREVVEKDTYQIMIVYHPDMARSIFVFVDKNDCVLTHGPVMTEATSAMLEILEIPH